MDTDHLQPIRTPENLNATIWRYIPLHRLEQILKDRGIYFCRTDHFDDPYEGMFPDDFVGGPQAEHDVRLMLCWRAQFYANCWHLSDVESATMWRLYADRGVALKSSFSRLQHAFPEQQAKATNGLERIQVSVVQYDSSYLFPRRNVLKVISHKLPHFAAESEVRAFFMRGHPQAQGYYCDAATPLADIIRPTQYVFEPGYVVSTEPSALITKILIHPLATEKFFERVCGVVARYGCNVPVEKSALHRIEYLTQMLARDRARRA